MQKERRRFFLTWHELMFAEEREEELNDTREKKEETWSLGEEQKQASQSCDTMLASLWIMEQPTTNFMFAL